MKMKRILSILGTAGLLALGGVLVLGTSYNALMTPGGMTAALSIKDAALSAAQAAGFSIPDGSTFEGHMHTANAPGKASPALSVCGTSPTMQSGSTDFMGQMNTGSANSGKCTMTFNTAYSIAPRCMLTDMTGNSIGIVWTVSTSAISITSGLNGSDKVTYICFGAQ